MPVFKTGDFIRQKYPRTHNVFTGKVINVTKAFSYSYYDFIYEVLAIETLNDVKIPRDTITLHGDEYMKKYYEIDTSYKKYLKLYGIYKNKI